MPIQISNAIYLTVLGPPPPQPTIAVPSGVPQITEEMLVPFQFDKAGRLAVTSDPPTRIAQHILALLFTRSGERVMLPGYGIGVQTYLFEPNDSPLLAELVSSIRDQVSYWEPGAGLTGVSPLPSDTVNGELRVQVTFTVGTSPTQHVVVYDLSGNPAEL